MISAGRARVLLGGLEQERVAAGDRVGQEPERDHRREVERRDRGDDADRLAHHLDVDTRRDTLQVLALQQVRHRRRRLDRLDPPPDLAVRIGEGLAHVGADQRGQFPTPSLQPLPQSKHSPCPPLRRRIPPPRPSLPRRLHSFPNLPSPAQRHPRRNLPANRIQILKLLHRVRLAPGAADVVAQRQVTHPFAPCFGWRYNRRTHRGRWGSPRRRLAKRLLGGCPWAAKRHKINPAKPDLGDRRGDPHRPGPRRSDSRPPDPSTVMLPPQRQPQPASTPGRAAPRSSSRPAAAARRSPPSPAR